MAEDSGSRGYQAYHGFAIKAVGYLALFGLAWFFYCLYQVRTKVRQAAKVPGVFFMPHSFLFGHLSVITKLAIKLKTPPTLHGQMMPLLLAREYPEVMEAGAVYMDIWPVSPPLFAVFRPDMMAQFTQDQSQPKHPSVVREMMPFTGAMDLASSDGQEWKVGRSMFNPGFSVKNLLSLVPAFVEEVMVFRKRLGELADKKETVKMENYTTDLTVDIIGRAVLGARIEAQKKPVKFMDAMTGQVAMLYFNNDLQKMLNPLIPIRHWIYSRTFHNEMMPYIQATAQNYEKMEGPKTILALALKSYVTEVDASARGNIPPAFLNRVVNHIKMFLFAGHDTTATTLAYAYYELSRNPSKLALLRTELDDVLGKDPEQAAARIAADPALLNQLPYTLGVVKETLRLWPVAGTVRDGSAGFTLLQPETGVRYLTDGWVLFGCSKAAHANPNFWPEPDAFRPERFTTRDEGDPLHPVKNAFRPWEMGPRNCIGQELASLELRLVLALTVREFDMEPAFSESSEDFQGEKAFQVQLKEMITAHPNEGMPMTIRRT
ncbi:cytochrome P450 monooxygenase aflN [Apiospora hydei]|uniref:Cytochrome P450 monooxygenase aflN n=1 Tax=Apiospora hydei TaxID=1337664 RepID=A0ABR1WLL2_9PEZI